MSVEKETPPDLAADVVYVQVVDVVRSEATDYAASMRARNDFGSNDRDLLVAAFLEQVSANQDFAIGFYMAYTAILIESPTLRQFFNSTLIHETRLQKSLERFAALDLQKEQIN